MGFTWRGRRWEAVEEGILISHMIVTSWTKQTHHEYLARFGGESGCLSSKWMLEFK